MRSRLISLLIELLTIPGLSFAATVRIGVFGLFRPAELTLSPVANSVLLLEADGNSMVVEYGQTARLGLSGNSVECLVGEFVLSATTVRASARGGNPTDLVLGVPGKIERHYHGTLEVRARGKELLAVVLMDREVAVASAVAAESPPGAPLEALEAQAVVTRSYCEAGRGRHAGFDFCDTTHCQFLREPPAADAPASVATGSTHGLVLCYKGAVLAALFSASCGGRTRSLLRVGLPLNGYPYFAVNCSPCLTQARRWETHLGVKDAAPLLTGEVSERARLTVGRAMGWSAVPGNNYSAWLEGETLVVRGRGAGHGLGLCQVGAAGMAKDGASFQEILSHYFPNTELRADYN